MVDVVYEIGGRRVLDGVSLRVERGEIKAVIGLSGSGKTTMLRNIIGLVRPTSGAIYVQGVEVTKLSEPQLDEVRLRTGFVFQGAALFDSLNVLENVAFGPRQHRRMDEDELRKVVRSKLDLVGLHNIEEQMPSDLSGGMRKRVGIARALAMEPELMLFDEPTAGLDPITARAIQDLIARLRGELGMSCLVVSHDLEGLFHFVDRAALLYDGRIVAAGRPAELRSSEDELVRQFVTGSVQGPIHIV
ncbi:MAG: ABC transporter ATP-binding protein [Armatimonadota bacterium]|nr:MAG: ABC transporter ATP-binding protein [Armatimonadota bacterium]